MAHPPGPVGVGPAFARIHDHWSPRIVSEANGWHVKLAKVIGDFVTHTHDVDEIFWVLRGTAMPDARYGQPSIAEFGQHRHILVTASGPAGYLDIGGRGPAVVLVHGVGNSGVLWGHLLRALEAALRKHWAGI